MTLEQCKQLEKWGLSQTGWGYYYVDKSPTKEPIWILYSNPTDIKEYQSKFRIKCPDLEQLLEFASSVFGKVILRHAPPYPYNICGYTKNNHQEFESSDFAPKQAIYKLLEKIMSPPEAHQ